MRALLLVHGPGLPCYDIDAALRVGAVISSTLEEGGLVLAPANPGYRLRRPGS
jgi:hypothetical protein